MLPIYIIKLNSNLDDLKNWIKYSNTTGQDVFYIPTLNTFSEVKIVFLLNNAPHTFSQSFSFSRHDYLAGSIPITLGNPNSWLYIAFVMSLGTSGSSATISTATLTAQNCKSNLVVDVWYKP